MKHNQMQAEVKAIPSARPLRYETSESFPDES